MATPRTKAVSKSRASAPPSRSSAVSDRLPLGWRSAYDEVVLSFPENQALEGLRPFTFRLDGETLRVLGAQGRSYEVERIPDHLLRMFRFTGSENSGVRTGEGGKKVESQPGGRPYTEAELLPDGTIAVTAHVRDPRILPAKLFPLFTALIGGPERTHTHKLATLRRLQLNKPARAVPGEHSHFLFEVTPPPGIDAGQLTFCDDLRALITVGSAHAVLHSIQSGGGPLRRFTNLGDVLFTHPVLEIFFYEDAKAQREFESLTLTVVEYLQDMLATMDAEAVTLPEAATVPDEDAVGYLKALRDRYRPEALR